MTRRLLFVHAHPDDESSKGAATSARYVDGGAEVVLVTCTGGEAGEVLNRHADPVPPERMGEVRARELEAAIAAIGFTRSHQLGYVDSGYHEDPDAIPPGTFARTPIEEAAGALAAVLRAERPHVVVTYPEDGGYPHPDHIMVHAITMRALELAEDPGADLSGTPWRVAKVYSATPYPTERVTALHEGMLHRGTDSPFAEWLERRSARPPTPEPTARIECAGWFDRRDAALRAHVTQIDPDSGWLIVPRDIERQHYPYEAYVLLRSDVEVAGAEDDLFAGLDVDALDAVHTPVDAR